MFGVNEGRAECYEGFMGNCEENVRFVVAGVVLGLEQLHGLGVVYKGINLENVGVLGNGYPVLTNFGHVGATKQKEILSQGHSFTSPEEIRGDAISPMTDFWALGVLIHYLCRGTFIDYLTFREREFDGERWSHQLVDFVNRLLLMRP